MDSYNFPKAHMTLNKNNLRNFQHHFLSQFFCSPFSAIVCAFLFFWASCALQNFSHFPTSLKALNLVSIMSLLTCKIWVSLNPLECAGRVFQPFKTRLVESGRIECQKIPLGYTTPLHYPSGQQKLNALFKW